METSNLACSRAHGRRHSEKGDREIVICSGRFLVSSRLRLEPPFASVIGVGTGCAFCRRPVYEVRTARVQSTTKYLYYIGMAMLERSLVYEYSVLWTK